jgi:hypothetical protein
MTCGMLHPVSTAAVCRAKSQPTHKQMGIKWLVRAFCILEGTFVTASSPYVGTMMVVATVKISPGDNTLHLKS